MKIRAAGLTDTGAVRKNNEDSFYLDPEVGLFVVADGMGGHASGEVASRMAVDMIRDYFKGAEKAKPVQVGNVSADYSESANRLGSAIRLANLAIHEAGEGKIELHGMGTTVAAALVSGRRLSIAHVGDSRIYLCRAGTMEQLTDDHSLVYEQFKRDLISREEAARSEHKNIITRALGIHSDVEVDLAEMTLASGDAILLCSDGLSGMVEDAVMQEVVQAADDPRLACEQLVSLANTNGGKDNITVIVAYFMEQKGILSFISRIFKWLGR